MATGDDAGTSSRWRARPLLGRLLRLSILLVPVACAALVNVLLSHLVPRPSSAGVALFWWLMVIGVSTATLLVAFRVMTRRLLPLAVLLDLQLAFPQGAPSRLAVARRQPNLKQLQAKLAAGRDLSEPGDDVARAETIVSLAVALSAHDSRTRGHSERVRLFTEMIADEMDLADEERDRLRWAALLHDIGKLSVPGEILNKPGRPDEREWAILRSHPGEGARLVAGLLPWFGSELGGAVEHHHEKFDGSGYPHGLAAESISLGGRIVAVADCFEVMTAARPYKRPMTPQAARSELVKDAGRHFDPNVVRAFLGIPLSRLWLAVGPSALVAQVPALAQLPERLGRTFTPVTGAATSALASAALVGTLSASGALATAAAGPTGPFTVYVVNDLSTSNSVSAISTSGNRVVATVGAGNVPLGIAITPDTRTAYVVDDGVINGSNSVTPIDLTTNPPTPGRPISTGVNSGSNWIAITPDGKRALVSDPGAGQVTPFDLTTTPATRGPLINVGGNPEGVAIAPDGRTAYVCDTLTNAVIPIDLTRNPPVAGTPIHSLEFRFPFGIAITPDGSRALVASRDAHNVIPIDLTRTPPAVGPGIPAGTSPLWIAITPDGNTAVVSDPNAHAVVFISLQTNRGTAEITMPASGSAVASPYAVAITPDGHTAYVSDGNGSTVTPFDLTTSPPTAQQPIAVGSDPRGIAIGPG